MPPKVDVIVPCFNGERWLGAALDSALAQTWPEVQVIVVDDGSTDRSVEVARGFGDRVRVSTGPNSGPSAARNRGLAAATGDWVQFLDADDLLLPTKVEACLAVVSAPTDVPFCRALTFSAGTRAPGLSARVLAALRGPPPSFDPTRPIATALTFEMPILCPLYPTAALRRVGGFDPDLKWLEDIDLALRLALDGATFVPVDAPLALVRDHATPGRQRLAPGAAAGRVAGEKSMMTRVREAGRFDPDVARVFADRLAYAGRQAWLAGQPGDAREAFALARALHPRPRPTAIPAYNVLSAVLGLERTEAWLSRTSGG